MKRVISFLLLCIICISLSFSVVASGAVPKKVMMSTESVVRILSKYSDGYGTGTGFIIKSDREGTLIITNYHVVKDNPYSISVWIDEQELINAEILAFTKQKDICVLKTTQNIKLNPVSLSETPAKQGDAIYAVGFPAAADILSDTDAHTSQDATITDGIVSALRQVTTTQYGTAVNILQISAAINSGNSGGPLFNIHGEVVGINTYGIADSQGIFGAIDISEIDVFLKENGIIIDVKHSLPVVYITIGIIVLLVIIGFVLFKNRKSRVVNMKKKATSITLREYMLKHPQGLGINDAVALLLPVALQLRDMHNNGQPHLQLSPDKIAIDTAARLLPPSNSEADRYTSGFAAKEVYSGTGKGTLSDIYSFCAVLFYASFGSIPANSLQRDDENICTTENISSGFADLINCGMQINPENRFDDIQKIILKMSEYNVKPFIIATVETETSNAAHSAKKKTRNPSTRKHRVLIALASVLLIIISGYFAGYGAAYYCVNQGNFDAAEKFLILPKITALHDPQLPIYVEAGQLMSNRQYAKAKECYQSIKGYLDSDTMILEADYCYASQLTDANNFDAAISLYSTLGKSNYKDSKEKVLETRYRRGLYILYEEKDYVRAYMFLSSSDYKKVDGIQSVLSELKELLYMEGVELYHRNEYDEAKERFDPIENYKDSSKYLTLTEAHSNNYLFLVDASELVNKLIDIFYFEDASETLLYKHSFAKKFLEGKWKTSNGGYYFTMKADGEISYNLPWFDYGDYYMINDGDLLLYPKNDEPSTRKLFTFIATTPDCVDVYCHKDGSIHTLYRQ